jgi:hypothetical protein
MKSLFGFALAASLAAACQAQSIGGSIGEVSIVDRETGARLTPYYHSGEYWIAGRPGARYGIEIRNRLGERLLAVAAVDGVNVLSGATASWDQEGYVFQPYEDYQIDGWRKSDTEVAAFTFTASPNSYAERTGRPENVGVIGIALFRERVPERPAPRVSQNEFSELQAPSPAAASPTDASAASSYSGPPVTGGIAGTYGLSASRAARPAPEAKLGTGHGEREYSYVSHTVFPRLQPEPNEIIRIRYDSLDNLVAMGVIKRPHRYPPTPNPFPSSPGNSYVPDPPG